MTSVFQGLSLSLAPGDGKERTLGTRLMNFIQYSMVRVLLVLCVSETLCDVYIISLSMRRIGLMMTNAVFVKKSMKLCCIFLLLPKNILAGIWDFLFPTYKVKFAVKFEQRLPWRSLCLIIY